MKKFKKLIIKNYNEKTNMAEDITDKLKEYDAFLHFLISKLFDKPTQTSKYHSLDARIINRLIENELGIKKEFSTETVDHSKTVYILPVLLSLEKKYPHLYHVAPEYLDKLIWNSSTSFLNSIVVFDEMTIINNLIYDRLQLDEDCLANDYNMFANVRTLEYSKQLKIMSGSKVNAKRLFKNSINADETFIRELMSIFPEFNYHKPYIARNRYNVFNGIEIPQKLHAQACYSYVGKYYFDKQRSDGFYQMHQNQANYIKLLDALYKLIIVESSPLSHHFCKRILNLILHDNILVAELMIHRKFEICYITNVVKYVPIFFTVFQSTVDLYRKTRDTFYLSLVRALHEKYPKENIKGLVEILEADNDDQTYA